MATPKITPAKIKQWVGATYAQRGLAYAQGGAVLSHAWRGQVLTGRVQGSAPRPYRVTIRFAKGGAEGDCSCPMDFNCKHVAAVLYASQTGPGRAAAPRKKKPPLAKRLAALAPHNLATLLTALVEADPELETAVEAGLLPYEAGQLSEDDLRDRVRALLKAIGHLDGGGDDGLYYDDYDDQAADLDEAELLIDQLMALVQRAQALSAEDNPTGAAHLLTALMAEVILAEDQAVDSLWEVINLAREALVVCWRAHPAEAPDRARLLRLLFETVAWDLRNGQAVAVAEVSAALKKHAGPAEKDQLREWVVFSRRQAAQRPPAGRLGSVDTDLDTDLDWARLEARLFPRPVGKAPVKAKAKAKAKAQAKPKPRRAR